MKAVSQNKYNQYIKASDIIRIKNILHYIKRLEQGYEGDKIFDPKCGSIHILNLSKIKPVYSDTSPQGLERSYNMMQYSNITKEIDKLSRVEGSIREQNTNFPWLNLREISIIFCYRS